MNIQDIPNDKLQLVVMAAVYSVLQNGGCITVSIAGPVAEIIISKVEVDG